jgi:hypothetical protein
VRKILVPVILAAVLSAMTGVFIALSVVWSPWWLCDALVAAVVAVPAWMKVPEA